MVTIFKRSNNKLYVQYTINGKVVQKSTRLEDTPQNRTLIKKEIIPILEKKILSGDILKEKPKTFLYYSEIYLRDKSHLKSYPQIIKKVAAINELFGSMSINNIKRADIKEWVHNRLQINTPKTVKEYLVVIRGIFDVAIDHEHIKDNVAKNIPLPVHQKQEIEPFSPEEVHKILSFASDWMRLYLAIGFYTGLRTGEILGLKYSDIDLQENIIHVRRNITKGKITTPKTATSFREVPILNELRPYLEKSYQHNGWVFHTKKGNALKAFPGNRQDEWKNLLEECKIEYRKIYATRHTYIVSMLKKSNLSILEIAQLAGHSSTQMIIQNYGKFIKGEHLRINRNIQLFTDNITDSCA